MKPQRQSQLHAPRAFTLKRPLQPVAGPTAAADCTLPWPSAVMERLFLSLEVERVQQKDCVHYAEATHDIADYIVGFYNAVRLHAKPGNLSPNASERESTSKEPIKLSEITWPLHIAEQVIIRV
ncbi:MAG: hypothetical protein EAZ34_00655 [Polaromonas sp.]|nr:MAG: hypothetical protein EAZ34_00655 [Polaromonas sp.]